MQTCRRRSAVATSGQCGQNRHLQVQCLQYTVLDDDVTVDDAEVHKAHRGLRHDQVGHLIVTTACKACAREKQGLSRSNTQMA